MISHEARGALAALGLLSLGLVDCARPPSQPVYRGPMTPYAAYPVYAPVAPNATPWPLVPVAAPQPAPTTVASTSAAAPWSTAAPTASAAPVSTAPIVGAGPVPVGSVTSPDPEIDGPAELAYVELGPVSTQGGAVADVAATVARMHGTIRRCYRNALVFDIKTKGDLLLVAQVGAKGEVVDAVADNVNGVPNAVVTCTVERLSKLVFAKPTAQPTILRVGVRLVPTAPEAPRPSKKP